ncbi:LOW QUALITY PROTEIN: zinc finger C2HC domain-containing protein 1C [Amazona ochrocephala]
MSVPVVNAAELGSSPYMEEAPNRSPSSMSKQRYQPAAAFSPWPAEPKQLTFPHRAQLAYIQKLEADGWKMEKEIEKQKALLEKLIRTKESLRRIQREKELAETWKRRYPEVERTHKQMTTKSFAYEKEEKILRGAARLDDGVFYGAQSAEAVTLKPGTTLCQQELAMGEHKKERLVARNSKIQGHIPMEHLTSCSKPAPKYGSSPSAISEQVSGNHPSTKVLCMQAGSAEEQGQLGRCSICRRKFLCTRLEKHQSICMKVHSTVRKVLDATKTCVNDTEPEKHVQLKDSEPEIITQAVKTKATETRICFCKAAIAALSDSLALLLAFLVILKLFPSVDASISRSFKSSLVMVFCSPLWDSASQEVLYVNGECPGMGDLGWAPNVRLGMEADGAASCSDCLSLLQSEPLRKKNWKQKHAAPIQTMCEAREVLQVHSKEGKVSAVLSLPLIKTPDYVPCPYCTRRFDPEVAKRHIPKCKNIKSRPPPPQQRQRC